MEKDNIKNEIVGIDQSGKKYFIESELVWISSGSPMIISGVDIWKNKWIDTNEKADVRCPGNDTLYTFNIFEIHCNDKIVQFASGEIAQGTYGFAVYE